MVIFDWILKKKEREKEDYLYMYVCMYMCMNLIVYVCFVNFFIFVLWIGNN